MYLQEGRWWVSLVLSLLSAAAKAAPAVGSEGPHTPPLVHQDPYLADGLPSSIQWPPTHTSAATATGQPYNVRLSPLPEHDIHYVPASSSPPPVSAEPEAFSPSTSPKPLLSAARPRSQVSGAWSSRLKVGSAGASNAEDNEAVSPPAIHSSAASILQGSLHRLPRLRSPNEDDVTGAGDDGSLLRDDVGLLGEPGEGGSNSPTTSPRIFRFPSPLPDDYVFQHPPPLYTVPGASFWTYSAWGRVNARPNEVILLTDVDDTLWSSGGWRVVERTLGGVDKEYARGDGYPGIAALYFVLAAGPHATAAADPPRQPVNFLLPSCPHPGFRSALLELCPAARSRAHGEGPYNIASAYASPSAAGALWSAGAAVPAANAGLAFAEISLPPALPTVSTTPQHSSAAGVTAAPSASSPPLLQGTSKSPSSPATFCAAFSFSPAAGLRRPTPDLCRTPLVLPPAVGLLTARLSTSFFKGWTRSPSFYHDIDWQLEHGARMMYGPNIFAGAWTHGYENNVELMRDTIGGQHSRGRAKVQGFRSALRAGLRPAAQVAATFAAARLQMGAENSTADAAPGGRQHHLQSSGSSTPSWSGPGPLNRQGGSTGRYAYSSGKAPRLARRRGTFTNGIQRTAPSAGLVTPSEQSATKAAPELGSLAAWDNTQLGGMTAAHQGRSPNLDLLGASGPSRKSEDSPPLAEFGQAIHFSRSSVCNRVVPVVFGDTGEKDLEVAASVAALSPDRIAAVFSHIVFADRELEKSRSLLRANDVVPSGAVPFTFNFNGRRMRAFQFTFDVVLRVGQGGLPSPRSFAELDDAQAYAIGQRVGLHLREAITAYSRTYLADLSKLDIMLQDIAGAATPGGRKQTDQPVQTHPLLFVKFSRLTAVSSPGHINFLSPPRSGFSGLLSRVHSHLKRKVWELTNYIAEEEPPQAVDVVPLHPIKKDGDSRQWDHGVPIIPYKTTISAAVGALLVQMISLQDLVNIIIASVRDLRSLGPLTSCTNVDPVEDHLFDVIAVKNLVGDRIREGVVQHYETYADAVAALRTFYHASRFCKTLPPAASRPESPLSAREDDPVQWFAEAEIADGILGLSLPWSGLQRSTAFGACLTSFALAGEPSIPESGSEGDGESQRQRAASSPGKIFHGSVKSAGDHLERHAPGALILARLACACLPQLLHWRSAGGGELEFLSAEWHVALTQAVAQSKRTSLSQPVRRGPTLSFPKGGRGGSRVESSTKSDRWRPGDDHARRLSHTNALRPLFTDTSSAAASHGSKSDAPVSAASQSRENLLSEVLSGVSLGRGEVPAAASESGVTKEDALARNTQRRSLGTSRTTDTLRRGGVDAGSTAAGQVAGRGSGQAASPADTITDSSVLQDLFNSRSAISTSPFDKAAFQTSPTDSRSSPNAAVAQLDDISTLLSPDFEALFSDYTPDADREIFSVKPQQPKRSSKVRDDDVGVEGALRRPGGQLLATGIVKDGSPSYDPLHTGLGLPRGQLPSSSANASNPPAADNSIACPTLSLHHLIRAMRPICAAQRYRLGKDAPCAILSRILYDEQLLKTFNAIQIWIRSGSAQPLYLENIGVTLDPSRPKGGRLQLPKLASTVVEKSEARERYNIQEARLHHREFISTLPFFMDPSCNPFA